MLECGTYSGYITHGRNKEKPCDSCRFAANEYRRKKRKKDNDILGYDPRRFKKHHITKEFYDKLLSKYKGKCWICKDKKATHIDHDHNCCAGYYSCGNCIRGLLCSNCNTAIGLFFDNPKIMKKAITYLSQPPVS
jgi:hypothetical protein